MKAKIFVVILSCLIFGFFVAKSSYAMEVDTMNGPREIPDNAVEKTNDYGDTYWEWTTPGGNTAHLCENGTCFNCEDGSPVFEPPSFEPPAIAPTEVPAQPTATPTPTSVPVCGADCTNNPNVCTNLASCNKCLQGPSGQGKTCQAPACNMPCQAPADCQGAQGGCTACTNGTCQPPATPTPVPACGIACNTPADCQGAHDGCTDCGANKVCQVPATPTPTSSPTPTPVPFSEDMCVCDGLNFTQLTLGNPANITAFGKVLGVNKNFAKIPTFTFTFFQSPQNSSAATIIGGPDKVNSTVIRDDSEMTRYQAIWVLNIPSNLDTTQAYRVQAHPDCSRKAAVSFFNPNSVVLGASTQNTGFFGGIAAFFQNLFGGNQNTTSPQISSTTPTPTLTTQQKKNLQLQTFRPATNVTTGLDNKNCTFIKFSF